MNSSELPHAAGMVPVEKHMLIKVNSGTRDSSLPRNTSLMVDEGISSGPVAACAFNSFKAETSSESLKGSS
jgi:hypothetical protein